MGNIFVAVVILSFLLLMIGSHFESVEDMQSNVVALLKGLSSCFQECSQLWHNLLLQNQFDY